MLDSLKHRVPHTLTGVVRWTEPPTIRPFGRVSKQVRRFLVSALNVQTRHDTKYTGPSL